MKNQIQWWVAVVVIMLAGTVMADKGWSNVASLKAGGEARSVNVNQPISKVAIACTSGNIKVQKITVIAGGNKTSFNVANTIKKGESQQISVGDKIQCDKLLVHVEGDGEYNVRVRP